MSEIVINKQPSFTEIWHEGYVNVGDRSYQFWLIHPKGVDHRGNEYECEVRWFFARVPKEVRAMYPAIIEAFKQTWEVSQDDVVI